MATGGDSAATTLRPCAGSTCMAQQPDPHADDDADGAVPPPPPPWDAESASLPPVGPGPWPGYAHPLYDIEDRSSHSRAGITSFVMAIVAVALLLATMVVSALVIQRHPQLERLAQQPDPRLPQELLGPLLTVACPACATAVLSVIGLIFGVVGLCQGRHRRPFAILGTIGNGLILLAYVALVLLNLFRLAAG